MSGWGAQGSGGGFGPPPGMGPSGMAPGPYGPQGMGMGAPNFGPPDPNAIGKLQGPAITMMVTTVLGMAMGLLSIALNIFGIAVAPAGQDEIAQYMSGGIGIVGSIVSLAIGAFVLYGLNEMRHARSWGMALGAVIVSMVPCLGSCWCVNMFLGIWALVVLNDQAVKASFQG